jgi:hypothetical protein
MNAFSRDRTKPSGRRPRCRDCERQRAAEWYDSRRAEFYARRQAAREAEREAEWKVLEKEWAQRREAGKKAAEAGRERQRKLLAELGVDDVSGEELSRRVRAAGGLYIRGAG